MLDSIQTTAGQASVHTDVTGTGEVLFTNKYCSAKMAANGETPFKEATYKILVLGDSAVGKTCLIYRYCDREFYESYISTIGELPLP